MNLAERSGGGGFGTRRERPWWIPRLVAAALLAAMLTAAAEKPGREEGEFRIYFAGKEIGREKFIIVASQNGAGSTSVMQFQNPADKRQKVQFETKLDMDARYTPRSYELKSDVNGQKGAIIGVFTPSQAMFEYRAAGTSRKSGVIVGNSFSLLDTNIFHHFIFLVRLFDFDSPGKEQQFEVVIPQEPDSGFLKVTELNRENIAVQGRKLEAHHLRADSGTVVVDLWVDGRRILHKIAVQTKNIEVVRN